MKDIYSTEKKHSIHTCLTEQVRPLTYSLTLILIVIDLDRSLALSSSKFCLVKKDKEGRHKSKMTN